MSRDLGTKLNSDSDIEETFKTFAKLTGNWGTYVLTINSTEDLALIKDKTFLTNYKNNKAKWSLFIKEDSNRALEFSLREWSGTQVIFIGDIVEAAGFEINEIVNG